MSILDKFKDSLSPEDYVQLEESITGLIEEKAKIRAEALVAEETLRIEALAEEFTEREIATRLDEAVAKMEEDYAEKTERFKAAAVEKIEGYAEKYVAEQVATIVDSKLQMIDEEYERELTKLEETVISDLDKFLDIEISTKISDELLESIAINETFKPIIGGIKSLFESHFVSLDVDSQEIVKTAEAKATKMTDKLNDSYSEKIALQGKIDELQTSLLIAKKTDGLTSSAKAKVRSMFEGKEYSEVNKKIDTFIEVLEERESLLELADETINDDLFLNEDEEKEDEKEEELTETVKDDLEIRLEKINYYL